MIVSDEDLTTPPISIVTYNFDISREKYNFTSHINTRIIIFSGLGFAPMVVVK
jgi:hypothetical protein